MTTPDGVAPTQSREIQLAPGVRLRSGTAARLAGLPVTTLRVWERRYGVVAATKTETGQRIYSQHDVARLRLLRRLTRSGHAIGTIAGLELERLQALADGAVVPTSAADAPSISTAVIVGRGAAHGLEDLAGCELRAVHDDLDAAEHGAAPAGRIDLLLVRLASLQPTSLGRVLAYAASLRAGTIVVVYAFGTAAAAEALREAGIVVRREPVTRGELARIVSRASPPDSSRAPAPRREPRRFSDAALIEIAERPSSIACECLRHMTEIVAQLASFEQYSRDCGSSNPADAILHAELSLTAGVARTSFEDALQRMLAEDASATPQAGW